MTKHKNQEDSEYKKALWKQKDIRRLMSYLPKYKLYIALAVLAMLVTAGSSSVIALLLGKMTDLGFYEKDPMIVWLTPLCLVGITVVHGFGTFSSAVLLQKVSQDVLIEIRGQMFERMIRWPVSVYQKYSSGIVASKFTNEASNALASIAEILTTLIRDILQIIALFGVLIYHNWLLTLVAIGIAPFFSILLKWISRKARKYSSKSQEMMGEITRVVLENYDGQRMIKIYNGYETGTERFQFTNKKIASFAVKKTAVRNAGTPLSQLLSTCAVSVVIVVALTQAQNGIITMGEFITYLSALLLMMQPIKHAASLNGTIANLQAASKSVFSMMDEPIEDASGEVIKDRFEGNVRFENVCFCYEGAKSPSVKNFSLDVKKGETVAFVGSSGAGKTTLVNMIPRFLVPSSGEIYFDGVAQSKMTLESLRQNIALVSQDVFLFDATIAENITYGQKDVSEDRISDVVKASCLTSLVDTLPDRVHSRVGEAGSKLSGGQKQRISIARALLKDAPILLLDEATSALDTESEKYIQESLDVLMKNRTTFVVAHRLSTIVNADKIVVMQAGEIQEIGTHEELLAKNGIYARLYNLQFSSQSAQE